MAISFVLGGFFFNLYEDTSSKYNFAKTSVDFIIPSPSQEQVETMSTLDHIDSIVPYGFVSKTINKDGKSLKTNIYILDNANSISQTVFSDALLISRIKKMPDNAIFLSSKVADALKTHVGDSVEVSVFNNAIDFTVAAIYQDDQRNVGGTVIVTLSGDLENDLPENYTYSGAYISSNNTDATKKYLSSYKPLGDLRSRDDFDSDEAYEIYLGSRENTDYTQSIFYREAYLSEISTRNDARLFRELITTIIVDVVGLLLLFIWVVVRTSKYCTNEVRKDIRNNYTIKQEQNMFNTYFVAVAAISVIAMVGFVLITKLIWNISLFSVYNIATAIVCIVLIVISWVIQTNKLNNLFAKKDEQISEKNI
ncbi:MAG: hypothetical protein K6F14_02630 [Clostridiales bacterium]|nr:hypothetical protein [Clostridiales bacterium]